MQTPITVDNAILELAPERAGFSVGDWEGAPLMVDVEVRTILLLESRAGREDNNIGPGR